MPEIYVVVVLLGSIMANGQERQAGWTQFRGPNGQGVAQTDRVPVRFGPQTNVLWKTPVPAGHSSPVIWNNCVFLTAVEPAKPKELVLLAIDHQDGRVLWRQTVQTKRQGRFHQLNNAASSTPAVDDKHVYVYFGTYGLLCYDHAGHEVWQREIATPPSKYGVATSPILYQDKVILVLDGDGGSSHLLAVQRDTGETVWQQPRPLFRAGWSTPMIFRHGEVDELVVLACISHSHSIDRGLGAYETPGAVGPSQRGRQEVVPRTK